MGFSRKNCLERMRQLQEAVSLLGSCGRGCWVLKKEAADGIQLVWRCLPFRNVDGVLQGEGLLLFLTHGSRGS